jgi:enolase
MSEIIDIQAREILDSRGNPTIEVDVILETGSFGRAAVPSGASTGAHEAVEKRDNDPKRYLGKGVRKAVAAVNTEIFDSLVGFDVAGADDEHHQWRRACRQPDRHPGIHDHAGRPPKRSPMRAMGAEIFHTLKKEAAAAGHNTNVGDEGGFAPNLKSSPARRWDFIMKSIEKAGYKPGEDVMLALDVPRPSSSRTASTIWKARASRCRRTRWRKYLAPISVPLPDRLDRRRHVAEDDWEGWKR